MEDGEVTEGVNTQMEGCEWVNHEVCVCTTHTHTHIEYTHITMSYLHVLTN